MQVSSREWQIELDSIISAYQKGFADLATTIERIKLPRHEIPDYVVNLMTERLEAGLYDPVKVEPMEVE